MIRATALAATLMSLALPVSAQSTFERLEAVAVTMNGMMFDAMVAQTPALEGNMPTAEWSDGLRTAYQCMYDGFLERAGEPAMAEMVTAMEDQLATVTPEEILNGGAEIENPEGLSDEQAAEIVAGCGMMEAFMTHMSSSGALQILMQDG
ncbi:hypothetical protein [Jannaschia sp. CCS1]|uniref:hypothetical protein n=1 Tax=Jannaschia sp. (strain CCS1) TaxID=290400 RepID=UPI000053BBED|nr:hypothetical protein [Jannaschia sp. CCS1]ABD53841.1 hypothetical protein Jann_0924 [Jannaschia sp. CCS1]